MERHLRFHLPQVVPEIVRERCGRAETENHNCRTLHHEPYRFGPPSRVEGRLQPHDVPEFLIDDPPGQDTGQSPMERGGQSLILSQLASDDVMERSLELRI